VGLVVEWATLHRDELVEDWRLAESGEPLRKGPRSRSRPLHRRRGPERRLRRERLLPDGAARPPVLSAGPGWFAFSMTDYERGRSRIVELSLAGGAMRTLAELDVLAGTLDADRAATAARLDPGRPPRYEFEA
jgi:hypothetical protein